MVDMYRYLMKYVGTYRVKAELDLHTNDFPRLDNGEIDTSFDDLYIPCTKGVIKHTYIDDDVLSCCFYDKAQQARNVYLALKEKYPKLLIELEDDGMDGIIYFNAKDIKKVATIVKPKTSGKDIPPFSEKNLPKIQYTIPAKDLSDLYAITQSLSRGQTMQFFKKTNDDFIKSLPKADKVALKESRLGRREFIHYRGLWEKYLKYVKRKFTKYSEQNA